jgi:hypothetical protein
MCLECYRNLCIACWDLVHCGEYAAHKKYTSHVLGNKWHNCAVIIAEIKRLDDNINRISGDKSSETLVLKDQVKQRMDKVFADLRDYERSVIKQIDELASQHITTLMAQKEELNQLFELAKKEDVIIPAQYDNLSITNYNFVEPNINYNSCCIL